MHTLNNHIPNRSSKSLMEGLIIVGLYIVFSLQILELVDKSYFNFVFLSSLKYIIIITLVISEILYMYLNNILFKLNLLHRMIIIMISIIMIPGVLISEDILSSLLRSIQVAFMFMFIFGTVILIGSKKVTIFLKNFLLFVTIVILALSDYLFYISGDRIFIMGNFKSFFSNSNGLGILVGLFLLPNLILKLLETKNKFFLFFYFFIFLNLFIILIFTNSRSAVLSFFLIISLIYYYKYIKFSLRPFKNILIILSTLIMFSVLVFSNKNIVEVLTLYVVKHESIGDQENSRSISWGERIRGIEEKPLFGWGYGINSNIYFDRNSEVTTEKGSTLLALIEEHGLFFGLILIFIVSFVLYRLETIITKYKIIGFDLIMLSILIGSLVNVLFESWLFYLGNVNAVLFWLILANLISGTERLKNKRTT